MKKFDWVWRLNVMDVYDTHLSNHLVREVGNAIAPLDLDNLMFDHIIHQRVAEFSDERLRNSTETE